MNQLASQGLRTMMFAVKTLPADTQSNSTPTSNEGDTELFEKDAELLGVLGLEDVLQDNVASCIRDFKTAGIKVWMLTGDKGETAESIAIQCGVLGQKNCRKFEINGLSAAEVRQQLWYSL
jgi:magnesium-transporting ATPase (P-type)